MCIVSEQNTVTVFVYTAEYEYIHTQTVMFSSKHTQNAVLRDATYCIACTQPPYFENREPLSKLYSQYIYAMFGVALIDPQ